MSGNIYIGTNSIKKSLSVGDNYIYRIYDGNSLVYENKAFLAFYSQDPFTLNIIDNLKHWDGTIQYSTNATTWTTWDGTTTLSSASYDGTANALLLRGIGNTYLTGGSSASSTVGVWRLTGTQNSINVQGSIEYLLDYKTTIKGRHPATASYCFAYMFYSDTCLINFSTLTLSTISPYGYYHMFDSSKILIAPDISATSIQTYGCAYMFNNCTELDNAPTRLNVSNLTSNACYYMFYGCSNLATAPIMSSIHSFGSSSCSNMFYGCTSLTSTPTFEINGLSSYSFSNMFYGCTALTKININIATSTVAGYCYRRMFRGCTSLVTGPSSLPATTLANYCYAEMFRDCTSLTSAPSMQINTIPTNSASSCCYQMYYNCTSLVTTNITVNATYSGYWTYGSMFYGCTKLTTAMQSLPATTIGDHAYYYMFYNCSKITRCPTLPTTQLTVSQYGFAYMFGNCTSLSTNFPEIINTTTMPTYACQRMFYNTKIDKAPELPATTLGDYCYSEMFYGCKSLIYAPLVLPALTVPTQAYNGMFRGCSLLVMGSRIDATSIGSYGCRCMYYECTSLIYSPILFAETINSYCYQLMFYACSSLVAPSKLPATTLYTYCYDRMYKNCTNLSYIPSLPATTLATYCYNEMFAGCTRLVMNTYPSGSFYTARRIPASGTGTTATGALTNMFKDISTSGNFRGTPSINTTYFVYDGTSKMDFENGGAMQINGDVVWYSGWCSSIPLDQDLEGCWFELEYSGDAACGYMTSQYKNYQQQVYSSSCANFAFWSDSNEAHDDIDLIFIFDKDTSYPSTFWDSQDDLNALRAYLYSSKYSARLIARTYTFNNVKYISYLEG